MATRARRRRLFKFQSFIIFFQFSRRTETNTVRGSKMMWLSGPNFEKANSTCFGCLGGFLSRRLDSPPTSQAERKAVANGPEQVRGMLTSHIGREVKLNIMTRRKTQPRIKTRRNGYDVIFDLWVTHFSFSLWRAGSPHSFDLRAHFVRTEKRRVAEVNPYDLASPQVELSEKKERQVTGVNCMVCLLVFSPLNDSPGEADAPGVPSSFPHERHRVG